jgi:hypothetical protein
MKKMKTNYFNYLTAVVIAFSLFVTSCNKDDSPQKENETNAGVILTDNGDGIGTRTLYKDTTYILDGFVFVNAGQTLTIQAGTVIKGKAGQGESASALIVARGAKIMAEGTKDDPIIFTAEADSLNGNIGNNVRGLWGGLIVLGKARLNTIPAEQQIEGIPTTETRGAFGGDNDADNSGIIKYVSIRHGGTDIGAGNEINGLSLGAVGSGTVIDYVEIIANADDGIEFFGGTAQVKHALVAYCGDDSFDYDMGYRGKGQFWVSIQSDDSDRNGEHDGGTDPEDGQPYAIPTIYNATYIGVTTNKSIITFRDNAGGFYYNSIFVNHRAGIDIEKLNSVQHSFKQWEDGNLKIENNTFYNIAEQTTLDNPNLFLYAKGEGATNADNSALATYFTSKGNEVANPDISATNPIPGNPQTSNLYTYNDSWFDAVNYRGAFGSDNWAAGWTLTFKN